MSQTIRLLLVVLIVLLSGGTTHADKKQDFRTAYQAYQRHVKAGDIGKATEMAAESYRLGLKVYGKKSPDAARLAVNYAKLLNDAGDTQRARKVLKGKLKVMEDRYGKDAVELVLPLIELGRSGYDPRNPQKGLDHFQRASTLLDQQENELYRAKKNFDIVTILLKRGRGIDSRAFVEKAHSVYSRRLQPRDFRLGLTSYHMGLWAASDGGHAESVEHFNAALTAFRTGDGKMGSLERTVRIQLVSSFENLQQHESATEHCLALGSNQAWQTPVSPVFSTKPVVPPAVIEDGLTGEVTLAFAVDEKGFVVNPEIANSTAEVFDPIALDMIRRFRYAPRFVDGKPVLTDGLEHTIRFSPAEVKKEKRITPGFDGFGRPPTRWRLDDSNSPGDGNPMNRGGGK